MEIDMRSSLPLEQKYQIFISATFSDLRKERQAVVDTILKTHNIPVGMEQFPSGQRKSWAIIKEWIDKSDIYLLIVGGRYGSLEPSSGKSFTHLEYEYAIQMQKPMILCVISDNYLEKKSKSKGLQM